MKITLAQAEKLPESFLMEIRDRSGSGTEDPVESSWWTTRLEAEIAARAVRPHCFSTVQRREFAGECGDRGTLIMS